MRIVDAVVKTSGRRTTIQPLCSADAIRVNERALVEITRALTHPEQDCPGRPLLQRLAARGLVGPGEPEPWERRDASALVSLEIEPVGACNLTCGHCFVDFSGRRMAPDVLDAVLEGAQALGAVELGFNGGEPLLHPRTLDYIERARAARLRVQLFTNGTRITPNVAERLADARLAKVAVSIDGFAETHDRLRGPGSHARAEAGIRALTGRGVPVQVTIAVHPSNAAEIDALTRRCLDDWGARWVRLATIVPMGRATHRPDLAPDDALFERYRESACDAVSSVPGALPCLAGVDKLFVSARGEVHGCHLFDGAPPLGVLPGRSLADIYHHPDAPTAGVLRRFRTDDLTECSGCAAIAACHGGCRARALRTGGHLGARDAVACRTHGVA